MNYGKEFTKGILKENPTLVGLLGMCPTLAVTTAAFNGIGMGLSTMFVLICSNIVISLLRKVIPEQVKLPCYIVIIASFVTVIQFLVHGFVPALYTSLGAFLELITVNCIILGRAEMFASKNNVLASALDGAGMGLGFTLALFLMGSVRESPGQRHLVRTDHPGHGGTHHEPVCHAGRRLSGAGLCDRRGLRPVQKAAAEENRLCRMSQCGILRRKV